MTAIKTIDGGIAQDIRGQIRFVNDFDMTAVKRFYIIKNTDTEVVRGWRGHRIEQRWFYVLSGVFKLDVVEIDNWDNPDRNLPVLSKELKAEEMKVLHIPRGYATSFRAMEVGSELLVYADYPITHCGNDNYTWPLDYFNTV